MSLDLFLSFLCGASGETEKLAGSIWSFTGISTPRAAEDVFAWTTEGGPAHKKGLSFLDWPKDSFTLFGVLEKKFIIDV